MKTHPQTLRTAAVALFASAAFLNAPVFGQAAPVVAPPPPVVVAPPPPIAATPPAAVRPTPAPTPRATPTEPPRATPSAPEARRTARPAPRAPERSVRTASRPAPSAPAQAAPVASAPEAVPATPAPAPVAETPPPAAVAEPAPAAPAQPAGDVAITDQGSLPWLVAAGLALVIALAGFVFWRRRRSAEEDYYYEEPAFEEPVTVVAPATPAAASSYQPALVTPAFRRAEPAPVVEPEVAAAITGIELSEADPADVEVLAAGSRAHGDRPWLEMLMRPIRAGANGDDTVVEFSLTVGNTGGVSAEDVRISAWMLASGEGSEMERLLIDPPAGATLSETRIEAGDGATVEATVTLPREAIDGAMLPVVVTDARYSLPNGGEGRTSASFAIGMPIGEELVPFPANPASGLNEGVEARVHGDVEHV